MKDGKVVDGFMGAQPEAAVREFVDKLLPSEVDERIEALIEAGDEPSLRTAVAEAPDHEAAAVALATLLVDDGRTDEALTLVERFPESQAAGRVAARARTAGTDTGDVETRLVELLDRVKDDDDARQEYVDLLDVLGPDDPRTADYRRQLTARLF